VNRFCIVAVRGMISKKNMEVLEKSEIDYIFGIRMMRVKDVYGDILKRGGRWQEVTVERKGKRDRSWILKVKENFQGGRRYIVCFNEDQATRGTLQFGRQSSTA